MIERKDSLYSIRFIGGYYRIKSLKDDVILRPKYVRKSAALDAVRRLYERIYVDGKDAQATY